jgi:hypothetical protein
LLKNDKGVDVKNKLTNFVMKFFVI